MQLIIQMSWIPFLIVQPSSDTKEPETKAQDQIVTPWDVHGGVSSDGKQQAIDYDKLIHQFGTRRIDATLLARFEKLTGRRPHVLLRRGMFFSHRYAFSPPTSYLSHHVQRVRQNSRPLRARKAILSLHR